jgi:hypothetical protein
MSEQSSNGGCGCSRGIIKRYLKPSSDKKPEVKPVATPKSPPPAPACSLSKATAPAPCSKQQMNKEMNEFYSRCQAKHTKVTDTLLKSQAAQLAKKSLSCTCMKHGEGSDSAPPTSCCLACKTDEVSNDFFFDFLLFALTKPDL